MAGSSGHREEMVPVLYALAGGFGDIPGRGHLSQVPESLVGCCHRHTDCWQQREGLRAARTAAAPPKADFKDAPVIVTAVTTEGPAFPQNKLFRIQSEAF